MAKTARVPKAAPVSGHQARQTGTACIGGFYSLSKSPNKTTPRRYHAVDWSVLAV